MTCQTCKHYDLNNIPRTPTGRLQRNRTARCLWKSTEPYPASVWRPEEKRPIGMYMTPGAGAGCACHVERPAPTCPGCGLPLVNRGAGWRCPDSPCAA